VDSWIGVTDDEAVVGVERAETVGERIRWLRLVRGFSQRELATCGVSYLDISRIEVGARAPSAATLRKLAAKLGVSPEFLETGRELGVLDELELWRV